MRLSVCCSPFDWSTHSIYIDDHNIEEVDQFPYLGCIVSANFVIELDNVQQINSGVCTFAVLSKICRHLSHFNSNIKLRLSLKVFTNSDLIGSIDQATEVAVDRSYIETGRQF